MLLITPPVVTVITLMYNPTNAINQNQQVITESRKIFLAKANNSNNTIAADASITTIPSAQSVYIYISQSMTLPTLVMVYSR